ncbi:GTP-binding protein BRASSINAZOLE INSENSITIVE PALE GREEN 2, chloroplastic [Macadamia integrifolia]|uniref:GTP-binding protein BRASSINAZOLE INSENSITIVE PALE GREEN 2, chloroplastic n=1 Tax=Macadamia integrifolia TaxID=60698 RepID=UPI001C4FE35A|nr:GTP-binding protein BRASSINAZOLE INSENSITIVE PALE GREEN 2, chloroplastic [Macadamia integrifolia]
MLARKLSPSVLRCFVPVSSLPSLPIKNPSSSQLSGFILSDSNPSPNSANSRINFFFVHPLHRSFSSETKSISPKSLSRDGNYDESAACNLLICPGCGVYMQDTDPKIPGYFIEPSAKDPDYRCPIDRRPVAEETEISNSLKKGILKELVEAENPNPNPSLKEKPVVCARCHGLRHYGKVKDATIENLLPDFDFDHTIGRKLATTTGTRSVVLMVVDAADFDGSFPRKVAKLVSATIDENYAAWKQGKSGNVPRVVLVVTKIDLLPPSLSPTRLEHWVRQRAREGGANKLTSVHLVSAVRDWGLKNLIDDVCELVGARGNVWAIGAQNAGKSTLINAIGKLVGGKVTNLTEAPVPGTTLGIIRVEGVLPGLAKLFDTPGLLHPHQISTRLTREEQKLVHISKELKPRTYRVKVGHSVHIAGLMRLDIEEASVDSIYLTVWASPHLPLHMGKTENSSTMLEDHFGRQLQPPIGEKRVEELGEWMRREFRVCGNSWDVNSVDVAAAGLGWFSVGLKGEASLGVWTYDGVDITLRNSLIPHRAQFFEVAGFTVSKVVSKADQTLNKLHRSKKQKQQSDQKQAFSDQLPVMANEDASSC